MPFLAPKLLMDGLIFEGAHAVIRSRSPLHKKWRLFGNNGFGTVWNGLTKPNELYCFSPLKHHLQNGWSGRSLLYWHHKEDWHMKRKYCTLYLSEDEYSVTLDALIRLKNKLIRQGRYADIVDEVILLLVDAKIKRIRVWELHRRSHTVFTFKTVWLFNTQTHYIAVQFSGRLNLRGNSHAENLVRSLYFPVPTLHSLNLSTEISINPIGSSCRNMTM